MEAYAAGQRCFGENRPQEMMAKAKTLPPLDRRLTRREYSRVTAFLTDNDMVDGYIQELNSAGTEAIPDFEALEGV